MTWSDFVDQTIDLKCKWWQKKDFFQVTVGGICTLRCSQSEGLGGYCKLPHSCPDITVRGFVETILVPARSRLLLVIAINRVCGEGSTKVWLDPAATVILLLSGS